MSITTYNTTYFDDLLFKDSNQKTPLDKNYLRILFKPGYSVQVRELNQLQSILQSQIDRFGSSVYREGTAVTGGNCTFDTNIKTVDVEINENYDISRLPTIQHLIDNLGLIAYIYKYEILEVEALQIPKVRFYIRYNNSVQNVEGNNVSAFPLQYTTEGQQPNVNNTLLEYDIDLEESDFTIGTVVNTAHCAGLFLSEGIFFIQGSFVHSPDQQLFFSYLENEQEVKNLINGYAYLSYTEYATNYTSDSTLLDNANGTPNYSAPGADRYTIDLTLNFGDDNSSSASNSIKLLTIENSIVIDALREKYTDLDRTFARRTYEESGDYIVDNFDITIQEFYNDGTNGGRYLHSETFSEVPTDIYIETDNNEDIIAKAKDLYSLILDPGIAYVNGYRIESTNNRELYKSKARDTNHISSPITFSTSANIGNYVLGNFGIHEGEGSDLPILENGLTEYDLVKSDDTTVIGTCRIRAIETSADEYALYIHDIKLETYEVIPEPEIGPPYFEIYRFNEAAKIKNTTLETPFVFELKDGTGILYNATLNSSLFAIPYSTVQNISNLEYYVLRTIGISGTYILPENSQETFADASNTIVRLNDGTITRLDGMVADNAKSITFTPPLGKTVVSACLKIKVKDNTGSRTKKKTKDTASNLILPIEDSNVYKLPHSDVIKITQAKIGDQNGTDITQYCKLTSDGQTSTYYTNATIEYFGSSFADDFPDREIWISYEYLDHDANGEYFTVNSYVTSNIDYSEIPSYNGIRLSDVYDFRPLILDNDTSEVNQIAIDPNSIFESDVKYYLSRKDSVVVSSSGEFNIITGEPSLNPIQPLTPVSSLLLYELEIPAYTFSTSDIKINRINNRRYTMRDIQKLETRIKNLEYYTSLSLLERSSIDKRIIDAERDLDRFKNGILVDSFYDHSIGDVKNEGYLCAVNTLEGGLSPKQLAESVPVKISSIDNVRIHANSITLEYEELSAIDQYSASETTPINAYNVSSFRGSISLIPSTDDWKETYRLPDIQLDSYGAYKSMLYGKNAFGTIYNEWTTNWSGVKEPSITDKFAIGKETILLDSSSVSKNLSISVIDKEISGNNIINTGYVPYIRSRKIYFSGKGLKPNTRLYAFFDGKNVTNYCNQLNGVPALNIEEINDLPGLYTDRDSTDETIFYNNPLITDSTGKIYGEFIIPNNAALKFKTGERIFRLTSSPKNNLSETVTIAEENYIATGNIIATNESITSITKAHSLDNITEWYNPIAQTFLIPQISEGIFATSIDIYFSHKSTTLPVTIQIVTVENGIPTKNIVPFSKVILDAADVNVDPVSGLIETNFRFSDPVYLKHGVEYAIILLTNDSAYRVWTATIGSKNKSDNAVINKNVYGGVLLTSQNASTWKSNLNRDLKFRLNRADFSDTGSVVSYSRILGTVTSIDITESGSGYTNEPSVIVDAPGTGATASANISNGRVNSFRNIIGGSGYVAPPFIKISAPTGTGTKIQAKAVAFINSLGSIYKISTAVADGGDPGLGYIDIPTVEIDPPGVTALAKANINPVTGGISSIDILTPGSNYRIAPNITISAPTTGGTAATATANIQSITFSGFNLNQTVITPPKTEISNKIVVDNRTYTGAQINNNYVINEEYVIDVENQIQLTNTLTSSSSYVSPMFSIERKSLICFKNEINNSVVDEDTADNGEAIAKYITKKVELNNASDQLNIYLDVNRPSNGSNIKVYVKFGNSNEWSEASPLQTIPVNSNVSKYSEAQYVLTDNDNYFSEFTIKIVMISDNAAYVPKVKDLRVIATV